MSALRKELTSRLANHQLLFVVGQSYSGTTATFSLVASSPQVGTLCSAGTWVCEDTMLFIRAGVFSDAGRWNPMTGQDEKWLRGLDKLTHVWDLRQPVLVDKSPPNLARVHTIARATRGLALSTQFVVFTRSPLSFNAKHGWNEDKWSVILHHVWGCQPSHSRSTAHNIRRPAARFLNYLPITYRFASDHPFYI